MRRMISQAFAQAIKTFIESGDVEWVEQVKNSISYDEENLSIVFNTDVDLTQVLIKLNSVSDLINEDEDSFFPTIDSQGGKIVAVKEDETGFEYKDAPSGGTKLYKHTVSNGTNTIEIITNSQDSFAGSGASFPIMKVHQALKIMPTQIGTTWYYQILGMGFSTTNIQIVAISGTTIERVTIFTSSSTLTDEITPF